MTNKEPETTSETPSAADLRSTLVKRLAVAGALVAVLLGVLAFFDYLATQEEPESPVYTKPVPVAPKKEVTQPVKPAETLPEPPPPEKPPEPPPKPAIPAIPPMPSLPAVPTPEPRPPAKIPARPAIPAIPAVPTLPPAARPVPPPESTATPPRRMPVEPTPAPPPAKPAEPPAPRPQTPAAPHPQPQPPTPLRLFSGYVVQAGVFTNVRQAEELHAKLTLNGIPSTLEARVQVGPFKNRAEADAAREKLKALGVEAIVIPPSGGH